MNRIFFTNKAHTRKINMPNIWPVKGVPAQTPIEFFGVEGLTLKMDPRLIDSSYFRCDFVVIINSTANYHEYIPGRSYLRYAAALFGTYNKYNNGYLHIDMSEVIKQKTPAERLHHSYIQKEAITMVLEGVEEFERYFMREETLA